MIPGARKNEAVKRLLGGAIAALATAGVFHAFWVFFVPVRLSGLELVEIEPGSSVAEIAATLDERGIIRNPGYFRILARITRRPLKAGEYGFQGGGVLAVLRKIQAGDVYLHRVLVPEGMTLTQIAVMLADMRLADSNEFIKRAADPDLLAKAGIKSARAEGYLFPDTYFLARGTDATRILEMMLGRFKDKVPANCIDLAARKGMNLQALITLASIIEKEARVADERAVISGVFHKRLKRGMKLQADPTVRYALQVWERKLTRADLGVDSPYNTYRYAGLPPGPICNPGLDSIRAAAEPADVPYLYFVTRKDGSGRHEFSRTLEEHNLANTKSKDRAKAR